MLKPLVDYAKQRGLVTEKGFAPKPAKWAILLADDGRYLGVSELGDTSAKSNSGITFPKAPEFSFSNMRAGGVHKSHFLIDSADVVALIGKNSEDAKTQAKHAYFQDLLRKAGRVMPELRVAADALADEANMAAIRADLIAAKAKPTDKVTLRIGDAFPVESDAWHDWWRAFRVSVGGEKAPKGAMRCFVSGELAEPAITHPKIKGLSSVGGMSTGTVLVGFDKDAFASFGLEQSVNCAMSEEAACAYCAALNDLLANHSHKLAGAIVTHWFRKEVPLEDDPVAFLIKPQGDVDPESPGADRKSLEAQQRAEEFLRAVETGQRVELLGNEYYALTLSASGGRVMVRDWMEGRFEALAANIKAWFEDLEIVHRAGGQTAPWPKFLGVLAATARELDEVPAPLAASLWRTAIHAEPVPQAAMARTLHRVRVDIIQDKPANHARMGLLKAYHLRKHSRKGGSDMPEQLQPYLNENHPDPAYHCGRLMAVLAAIQRAALGDVGAGVVQRYYAAASSTPALVLGRLTRQAQFHLNKINPKLTWWYESKLSAIWGSIGSEIPRTLDLEQQSLFALGYYQQLADLRTKRADEPENGTEADSPTE